ncbi:hypothetical protein ACJX0J_041562, partial [Zea mays]
MVGGGTRTRRGRGRGRRSTRRTEEQAQQDDAVQQQVEQQAAVDAAQQDDDDAAQQDDDDDAAAQQDVSGSGSSGSRSIYLRGPASLPKRPILRDRRPLIRPDGERSWMVLETAGGHGRNPNGILGLLCREHFPGLVEYAGVTSPAYTFDHYAVAPDAVDRDGRQFNNKAERVKQELWDFFRCDAGYEARADVVSTTCCKKLVVDMHYEARIQAIVTYHGSVLGEKVNKKDARTMSLTPDQYLQMIPHWCAVHPECWEQMVQRWCSAEWDEAHNASRERRLLMQGPSHHQGSRSLGKYAEAWSAAHGGAPCSTFSAYAMAHKGKATSDVTYNPDDGPEAYTNPAIHSRLSEYTAMAKEVHGPDYDPRTEDIDGDVLMRVGGGKRHGRYWIADGAIDSSSTPTLSQVRARSTSASPAIRPRQDTSQHRIQQLQTQLDDERRQREELEKRMAEMFAYMQSLGAAQGHAPPPPLFPAADPT